MHRYQRLTLIACLVFVPAVAHAQGSIGGVVKDASGAVLPGVTVEAASPALIEKVRSVTTDNTGQYKIVDLRPGTYAVTFTLGGFSAVKREGIEIAGAFAATVNADLVVGSVTEVLTVTAEAPTVDVQNTRRSNVISEEIISSLPAARSQYNLAVLVPGVTLTSFTGSNIQDVGGTRNLGITIFSVHGSRAVDQRLMVNGLTARNLLASAWASNFVPDMGTAAEVTLDYSSGSAEAVGAGFGINLIPKEGGNTFKASIFAAGSSGALQANNYSQALKNAGLSAPNELHRNYDINPSFGGPIFKNKLWFFGSVRWQENSFFYAGAYANKNGGDLTKWTYEPDLTKRGEDILTVKPSVSARLTWQATPKNKFAFSADPQNRHWIGSIANASPEEYSDWVFGHESFTTVTWSAPVTNRLLLDARYANHAEAFVDTYPAADDPYRRAIPVREQSTGFLYRGKGYCCAPFAFFGTQDAPFIQQAQASVSYVTGAHAMKVGFQDDFGTSTSAQFDNEAGLFYTFNNGVPVSIEQHALPFSATTHLSLDLGIYAQDKWTVKRATINAGLRFDFFRNRFPEQHLGPASFVPDRNITIPARDYANMKDVTPRVGVAYDLFGNGKTALKASWGKYLIGADPAQGNPITNLSYVARRSWTPSLPVGHPNYYTPQCDLNTPVANGDCGALDNALFGKLTPSAAVDPETYTGWGHRQWNQEFSVSVQHQVVPRVAVDAGYFRRWYGNFTVVDNRAVTASDFVRYGITAPVDSRLPASGQPIGGLLEVSPAKAALVDNITTFADNFGTQYEHWNGVDVTVSARPQGGVTLQGGLSTGRTSTDNCDLRSTLPEITLQFGVIAVPESQCHIDTNFLTQVKFLGSYLVPKIDVQFGVTFQSTPGPQIMANSFVTSAATQPQVPLSGTGFRLVNLVTPGSQYAHRANQLDLRFSKILRFGPTRAALNLDLANALNANYTLGINGNYGPSWQAPLNIMDARLVKISGQFDF
jgi:hypothetical protein